MAGGAGVPVNDDGWADDLVADLNQVGLVPTEPISLGEVLRRVEEWAEWHGHDVQPLTVRRGTGPVNLVEVADLVDVLSDYVHGRYFEWYETSPHATLDSDGHRVVEE